MFRCLQALAALVIYLWLAGGLLMLVVAYSHPAVGKESRLVPLLKGDLDTLARTLYGEARGEGVRGMQAIAWVVVNRAKRGPPRFPSTIAGVCRQPHQFTCWSEGDPNAKVCAAASEKDPVFVQAIYAASSVLAGMVPDPTRASDHYHTVGMTPYPGWAHRMQLQVIIGQHRFYAEQNRAK